MSRVYFVTGTDTDVGKTEVAAGLLAAANRLGLSTAAVKPVAAGCDGEAPMLRNHDASLLRDTMSLDLPYEKVNPVALKPAIAPHIAAAETECPIQLEALVEACQLVMAEQADLTLIEGAGGWRVPLGPGTCFSELPQALNSPVILVVGMRLGCLNHAVLTAESIVSDGLQLAGWVANTIDADMPRFEENLLFLKEKIESPCLGVVPHIDAVNPSWVAVYLEISPLITC